MKHAYLILAHGSFGLLKRLIAELDDERNDLYIHVDKKSGAYPEADLRNAVKRSGLFFTERTSVNWGAYSQIQAELLLLREAAGNANGGYAYYHLLSGIDLPLKTQDEIHRFFEENAGKEFLECGAKGRFLYRIAYYYPFQEIRGRGALRTLLRQADWKKAIALSPVSFMATIAGAAQRLLFVNRVRKKESMFFWGSNWFSVTHDFAEYVLSRTAFIEKYFSCSLCADEIFMQTLLMNSPFRDRLAESNLRLIDWKRGHPYTFRSEDYGLLMSSGCLFARKFDDEQDPEIIQRICETVLGQS